VNNFILPYNMTLVIVESPAKCKKIEGYLGAPYKCIASFGHIRELCKDTKEPKYQLSNNRNLSALRAKIHKANDIILATDDDREGEAIAWHICDEFNLPLTTKRIVFHEITKKAIQRAVRNPTVLDMNKVNSQRARQFLDLIVGFTITPVLWNNISRKANLSAGRCQTPALRLVYENQKDIDASPGKESYDTTGTFMKIGFSLHKQHTNPENMEKFLESSVSFKHMYSVSKPKKCEKKQPRPFTTSTLQQAASNELSYSPKRTMQAAQKLYEAGHITYMRTDSRVYSAEFIKNCVLFIKDKYGQPFVLGNIKSLSQRQKKDNAQEAHEAIRPTDINRDHVNLNNRLYELIRRNTLQSCMMPAEFEYIVAKITAPEDTYYRYRAEKPVFLGWKIVGTISTDDREYQDLRTKKPCKVKYSRIYSKYALKELKTHYTEAKLVQFLEKKGIGRPSTFASLISKIQDREFVIKTDVEGKKIECKDYELVGKKMTEYEMVREFGKERNKLVIQQKGKMVIEFLMEHFNDFFEYGYTQGMENELDLIAKGEKQWRKLCDDCGTELRRKIADMPKKADIKIDEFHTYIIGKFGPVIKYKNGEDTKFISVRDDIDLAILRNGGYTLKDISVSDSLGSYKGEDIIVKKGRYGSYVTFNGKNHSIKKVKKPTLENIIPILEGKKNSKIVRTLNETTSIRKGKWGPYIFHKKEGKKKPTFWSLKECDLNIHKCSDEELLEWIGDHFNV
jgi:DNA topoisomerase-1